jgi:hypothetical protein
MVNVQEISKLPFFFIIGRPRSGTTLLRTLLDAHPNVCIPQESPVILNLYRKYGGKVNWKPGDIEAFFHDLNPQHIFGVWNIDEGKLKTDLGKCVGENSFETVIKVLYTNFNSIYSKTQPVIIGDKNPVYSVNFHEIFPVMGDAKFIHLTRDYRDQIVSMKKMDFEMSQPALVSFRWELSVKSLYPYKAKYPDKFLTIKYEDLVKTPENKLKEICNHLNIEYDPVMLDFHKIDVGSGFMPKEAMKKYHSSLFNPLNTSKVNSWEKILTDKEVKIADVVIGKSGELAGYKRKYKHFNLWLYITVLPILFYGWIWNLSRKVINVLPFNIKMAIYKISPALPGIYRRLKNKKLVIEQPD